ncbi:hypothetical protein G6F35_018056 [Rhizopus arrhizus]|nr:hypothetical protein G6F35_018056 [Rhizopus arrhizus]
MMVARTPALSSALMAFAIPFSDVSPDTSIVRLVPSVNSISNEPVAPLVAVRSATTPDCRVWAVASFFTLIAYSPTVAPSSPMVAVRPSPTTLGFTASSVDDLPRAAAAFCKASTALCTWPYALTRAS